MVHDLRHERIAVVCGASAKVLRGDSTVEPTGILDLHAIGVPADANRCVGMFVRPVHDRIPRELLESNNGVIRPPDLSLPRSDVRGHGDVHVKQIVEPAQHVLQPACQHLLVLDGIAQRKAVDAQELHIRTGKTGLRIAPAADERAPGSGPEDSRMAQPG